MKLSRFCLYLFLFLFSAMIVFPACDDDDEDDNNEADDAELVAFIEDLMEQGHIPGLAAAVVKGEEIIWSGGFGTADFTAGAAATADTLFMIASVSKTVTGVALMQVYDDGLCALNDDVSYYLPFDVYNPRYPNQVITIRHLLTHTSGIADNWDILEANYVDGDSPIPLGDFLEDYLVPGGAFYRANGNFLNFYPGEDYEYTNVGAALVGYLVESITGVDFAEYCDNNIFTPLGMDHTAWHLADLDTTRLAVPYEYLSGSGSYASYGQYGYPDYPDGLLRTSAEELAVFLIAFINRGAFGGQRILTAGTADLMRQTPYPGIDSDQGLIWYYRNQHGSRLLGHNGAEYGAAAEMFFRPADNVGFVVMINTDWRNNTDRITQLENKLLDFGADY